VVVDPRRDIGVYLEEAKARRLTIERVIETHLHADFLSGHLELAAQTGAAISFGEAARVGFPIEALSDGQRLSLGEVALEIVATPGHTTDSICIVVYERDSDDVPTAVLTGDTLFVGDVGRPDLHVSDDAGLSADELARQLYRSLHDKLLRLPDATVVFPAHGAGSSCGKRISNETSSTIGEQRRSNYALQVEGEDAFVKTITEGQPPIPRYFEYAAGRNRDLRPLLDQQSPPLLNLNEVLLRWSDGATLLDGREPADYAAGHLRGAVSVALQGRFAEWGAAVLDPDRDVVLVGDPSVALEAKIRLARVGFDRVVGQLDDTARVFAGRPDLIDSSSRLTVEQFAELRGLEPGMVVLDVRSPSETADGTLPGAREIPLAALVDSVVGLEPSGPLVIYCATGSRSLVAASVLRAAGFEDVSDLLGGYAAWTDAGLPIALPGAEVTAECAPQLGARAAKAVLDANGFLMDVREPSEWQAGHAPGAVLIPMGTLRERRTLLPHDRRIVVVCRSGGRSAAVTQSLRAWGFDAVNLAGGMCAWAAAGLPIVHDSLDAGLVVHNKDPLNCETSIAALVGGLVMPNSRFYVRNHFPIPALDPTTWKLNVHGLVEHPLRLTLRDLHRMRSESMIATLECAGNGRSTFDPPVEGEQWHLGAVSTAEWTGVPLVDVLEAAGPGAAAREVRFRGADAGVVPGSSTPIYFERSLTLDDAKRSSVLLAYAMNGEPLPAEHGFPLRAIVPKWYAVASVKWLTDLDIVGDTFAGFFQSERYYYEWARDGEMVREPVRLQRVRSLITEPTSHAVLPRGDVVIRGVAWSGAAPIAQVDVSVGDGPWEPARLLANRPEHGWLWWELLTRLERPGPTRVRARATDLAGWRQPERSDWNRLGYGGNAVHSCQMRIE
jgi:rhodanese-related sulfurtransferase/DMSO/TMAO reductase YedYZ molybdopterin-dependent catalytic subunit/glyoxylase-like metal-dependent hydrolase (beta-lactamase superfamily II)